MYGIAMAFYHLLTLPALKHIKHLCQLLKLHLDMLNEVQIFGSHILVQIHFADIDVCFLQLTHCLPVCVQHSIVRLYLSANEVHDSRVASVLCLHGDPCSYFT